MQISYDVIETGIEQGNRKAFYTLLRLKMEFPHGWITQSPEKVSSLIGISASSMRRHLKKLEDLGFIEKTYTKSRPDGVYVMKCLDRKKKPLEKYQRVLRKKGLYKPLLSTVRLTKQMCDKEILAHLTAKHATRYFAQCTYMMTLKEDNEILHKGGDTKNHHPMKVRRIFGDTPIENVSPNRKMVISDKKMAAWLGITLKDFRRNVKLMWLNTGLAKWTSSLIHLEIPWIKFRMGEVPNGVFIHKGNAYTHTTQYHFYQTS